jgi:hypothetical protein
MNEIEKYMVNRVRGFIETDDGEIPVEGYLLEKCKWKSDDDYYIDNDIDEFFIDQNKKIIDGFFELEEYREEKIYDTLEESKKEFEKIKKTFN